VGLHAEGASVTELDLTDPEVREMADRNHTPDEMWSTQGVLISVHCDTCGQPWPCETRKALRDYYRPQRIDDGGKFPTERCS